jgi:hypothetical protein
MFGQLHLVTGSPTGDWLPNPGYESAVFRLGPDGTLARVTTIVPAAAGIDWILESQSMRKMVIGQRSPQPIVVFDYDKVETVKVCSDPGRRSLPEWSPLDWGRRSLPEWSPLDWSLIDQWLVDSPARGPALAMEGGRGDPLEYRILAMVLDPSVPCDKSFAPMDAGELRHAAVSGVAGVADTGGRDVMDTILNRKTGRLQIAAVPPFSSSLDQDLPLEMFAGMEAPWTHIFVNNSQIMAVSITDYGGSHEQRLVVFRKRDKTWLAVPKVSERLSVRGFGAHLAITAAQVKDARLPQSLGQAEWRAEKTDKGPATTTGMFFFPVAYPGRLHLYDANTEQVRTITTNQGDSEILLVDGQTVYYRASDRLYSVAFTPTGFSEPKILAKAEPIRDAHWAFMKR